MNSLADNILGFVRILRQLGVRISTAEAIDAAKSLEMINPLEKSRFKAALKATLVKNNQDRANFEKAFNLFFVTNEEKQQMNQQWQAKLEESESQSIQAGEELVFQGRELKIPEELKDIYKMIPEQEKKRLQEFLEKTSTGYKVDQKFQPVVENILKSTLSFWHRQLPPEDLAQLARARRKLLGMSELDNVIDSAQSLPGGDSSGQNPLLAKNMRDINENEIPQVTALIKRLAHKLSTRISRLFRLSAKKDAVDIRRSIRLNMRYGGTMIVLKYKTRKIQKPKIVILCDVSASMTKYVRFTLPLLYGLSSVVKNIESFIFATELECANTHFQNGADFLKTAESLLDNSEQMGKGTNIFIALESLREDYPKLLSKSSLLFIISDANTMSPRETAQSLKIVSEKVKQVIWLNTQPKEFWAQNAAIGEFAKYCAMFECYTLAHLAQILSLNLTVRQVLK